MSAGQSLRLNPLMRIRFEDPPICDLLLERTSVVLPDDRMLGILARLDGVFEAETAAQATQQALGIGGEEAMEIVTDLREHAVLVPEERHQDVMPAVEHWIDRGWLDGLILHLRTRDLQYADDTPRARGTQTEVLSDLVAREGGPALWSEFDEDATAIDLPSPAPAPPGTRLRDVLLKRRSNRPYRRRRISQQVLANIMGRANETLVAMRRSVEDNIDSDPTAWLHSSFTALETYVFVHRVDGIRPGLYCYDPDRGRLVLRRLGDFEREVTEMCIGQVWAAGGACTFAISAQWERYMFRYRHARAYRNLMVNVAELGQRYLVAATAEGLETFMTPNLLNEKADELVGVDGYEEGILYAITVG